MSLDDLPDDDAPPTLPTGYPPPPELYPGDCVCICEDGSAWIQRGSQVIPIDPRWRVMVSLLQPSAIVRICLIDRR